MKTTTLNSKHRFTMNGATEMATTLILVIFAGIVMSFSDISRMSMDDFRKETTFDSAPVEETKSEASETSGFKSTGLLQSENVDPLWESVNKNVAKALGESRQAIYADLEKNVEELFHTPINHAGTNDGDNTTGSDIAVALAASRQEIIEDLNRNVKHFFYTALHVQKTEVALLDPDDLRLDSNTAAANALAESRDIVFDELSSNVERLYRSPIHVTASKNDSDDLPLQTAQADTETGLGFAAAEIVPSFNQ